MDIQSSSLHSQLPHLLSVAQTAKILGIADKTLRDHVLYRRMKYIKIGGRVLFHPDDLDEFIKRNTVHPTEKRIRKGANGTKNRRSRKTGTSMKITEDAQGTLLESGRSDSGKKSQ
jgi:excisionase family DNA binding protein